MIDLNPHHLGTVRRILAAHVPACEIRAFGSRATWTAKDYSDLDLAVVGKGPLDRRTLARLKEAFEESDLPMRVDVHDWHTISTRFRAMIMREYVVLQHGADEQSAAASEWRQTTLGEICEMRGGSVFPRVLQGKHTGTYPFAKVSDMNLAENTVYIQDAANWVNDVDLPHLKAKPFPPQTTVFAKIGEALKKNRLRYLVRPTLIDNNMMGVTPFANRVDPQFFFYALSQFDFAEVAVGTALPYLTVASLSRLELSLPPLPEQRAIAHVLGTLDDKIALNRRMNETLEAMARALFQDWFVDFGPTRAKLAGRAPYLPPELWGLFPARLVESELGEIPAGWEVGPLSAVVTQLRDQENPLVSPNAIFSHFSIPAFDDGETPRREQGASIKSIKSGVPPGVVLLSKLNPNIERVWLVDVEADERAVCSTEFLVLRPRPPFARGYVYCLTRSPPFRQQIESLVTGTSKSHQRARAGAVLSLEVVFPPVLTLRAFEMATSDFLKRTLTCRREISSLAVLRDTLLPKLVSGEVRVNDIVGAIGSAD